MITVICALMTAPVAVAQNNPFATAIKVNDRAITYYELDQRARFIRLLNAPGDPETVAREQLIEERLKQEAMARAGIQPTPEEVSGGMEEFAARANLSAEQFVAALRQGGVDEESFRDFVSVGLGWRQFVGQRFAPRAQVTEAEIDRRVAQAGSGGGLRVLLSEIVLPNVPQLAEQSRARAERAARVTSISEFSALAREFSFSPSRARGGRLDWAPLSNYPPQLGQLLLGLSPGETTQPLNAGQALVVLQLRDIEETPSAPAEIAAVDYAAYYIPGGRTAETLAQAKRIRSRVDTCDDLYGIAKGQPDEVLERGALPPSEVPQDIALELAKLDDGEVSTNLTRANGQTLVFLMLCGRTTALGEDADRESIRNALFNERVERLAEGFLADLEADALIREQ
nr:peptidylprolyl isomerase [Nereida sp. MMG025]